MCNFQYYVAPIYTPTTTVATTTSFQGIVLYLPADHNKEALENVQRSWRRFLLIRLALLVTV